MSKDLNTTGHKTIHETEKIRCWYCRLHGNKDKVLDKYGCCKRCGTNLKRFPNRASHPYPDMSNLDAQVLGYRQKFTIPGDDIEQDQRSW